MAPAICSKYSLEHESKYSGKTEVMSSSYKRSLIPHAISLLNWAYISYLCSTIYQKKGGILCEVIPYWFINVFGGWTDYASLWMLDLISFMREDEVKYSTRNNSTRFYLNALKFCTYNPIIYSNKSQGAHFAISIL